MSIAIVVDWSGPYSRSEASHETGSGLYLVYGRNRMGRAPDAPKLLYCGISHRTTGGIGDRIAEQETREFDHPDNQWWIGRVSCPTEPDRAHLEAAEWLLIYFSSFEHPIKKTANPPRDDTHLINRWFKRDGSVYWRLQGGAQAVFDVLSWNASEKVLSFGDLRRA